MPAFGVANAAFPDDRFDCRPVMGAATPAGATDDDVAWLLDNAADLGWLEWDALPYAFAGAVPKSNPFKWNQYGGTLGGPVQLGSLFNGKDKLFFMGNYESFRKRGSSTGLFSLAPAAFQTGDFSTLSNRIYDPLSRVRGADGPVANRAERS